MNFKVDAPEYKPHLDGVQEDIPAQLRPEQPVVPHYQTPAPDTVHKQQPGKAQQTLDRPPLEVANAVVLIEKVPEQTF